MYKNLFAWASISEKGTKDGKKGNQTGIELKIANYYNFGQNWVISFKRKKKGKIASEVAKRIVSNRNVGYCQSDRKSLYDECERIGWDIQRIHEIRPCNCDCSMLIICIINFVYCKSMLEYSYTSYSLPKIVERFPDKFKFSNKSLKSLKFRKGDIVGKPGHVIINV